MLHKLSVQWQKKLLNMTIDLHSKYYYHLSIFILHKRVSFTIIISSNCNLILYGRYINLDIF